MEKAVRVSQVGASHPRLRRPADFKRAREEMYKHSIQHNFATQTLRWDGRHVLNLLIILSPSPPKIVYPCSFRSRTYHRHFIGVPRHIDQLFP